ncbi:MAG: hypothetical protein QOF96_4000 [Actinomycetota bacterium]|nr:hypothetical protein [Actinomycetota bacterium]
MVGIHPGLRVDRYGPGWSSGDPVGRLLGVEEFGTTTAGYEGLLVWLSAFGPVLRVGVEGKSDPVDAIEAARAQRRKGRTPFERGHESAPGVPAECVGGVGSGVPQRPLRRGAGGCRT